ncbi:unnamed protein product [Periconia digitata]|uniref:Major facilitator superfamily (MFS) profile domain-containing protein n=1 Tax=Periconia digitata TaxID=1303443 RepID=A0A9W4UFQ2_9PLEO|nr:unnamed protein product [Periconia digitata]
MASIARDIESVQDTQEAGSREINAPETEHQSPVAESMTSGSVTSSIVAEEQDDDDVSQSGDNDRTLWQNVKKYRKICFITLGLSSTALLYGYDYAIVSNISGMQSFQKDLGKMYNNEWILPSRWLSGWTAGSPGGAMLGTFFSGRWQDLYGRRIVLGCSSLLCAMGVAIMFPSYLSASLTCRRVLFLMGKIVQGFAIGVNVSTAQTYLSEILPRSLRASAMSLFPIFTCLGQIVGALVVYTSLAKPRGYVVAFGSQWLFSLFPVIVAFCIPESPAFYIRNSKLDKAREAQARLSPPDVDAEAAVRRVKRNVDAQVHARRSSRFMHCFSGINRRRTFIVMWAQSLQSVFGLVMLSKAAYFLQLVGLSPKQSVIFVIVGLVLSFLANIASIWIVARVERKKLIMVTMGLASLSWLGMGIANCFSNKEVGWWTGAFMILVAVICSLGVWPASYTVSSETSSLRLRARTQAIGWLANSAAFFASGFGVTYIYNPDGIDLRGKIGFTYFGSCVLGVLVTWLVVPEMKGRSVEEIDRMFECKVGAREWVGWKEEAVIEMEEGVGREKEAGKKV